MSAFQPIALDTNLAKEADSGGYIDRPGKYVGRILFAEFITASTGSTGLEFHFESNDKEIATFTVYSNDKDGKPQAGLKKIMGLMTCAGVRVLTPTPRTIEKYVKEVGGKANVPTSVAVELDNKPIGLLLQREEFQRKDGNGVGYSMKLFSTFKADTEQTAGEILNRVAAPKELADLVMRLDAKGVIQSKPSNSNNGQSTQAGQSAPASGFNTADLDDDLPF